MEIPTGFFGTSIEFILLMCILAAFLFWLYLYFSQYGKVNKGLFQKIITRKREKKKDTMLTLKNFFFDNLITFQKKLNTENKEGIFKEFTLTVRKFFADLYKINYRFTYDELIKEIEKMKIRDKERIIIFLRTLSRMEYSGHEPSLLDVRNLLAESRNMVELLTRSEKEVMKERAQIKLITRETKKQPVLIKNIPDQTWRKGQTVSGLNLNDFFYGEKLTYKALQPSSIKVEIKNGIVTFISDTDFSGTKYTVFLASNKYGETTSNIVNLNVIKA